MAKRGNGEGSIYQTANGRWRGSVSLPTGGRKYVSARTRQEVAAKLAPLAAKAAAGGHIPVGRLTVGTWLSTWLDEDARPRTRESTFSDYQGIVNNHLVPAVGSRRLTALRPDDISRLHRDLLAKGLSTGRVLKIHRVLCRALHIAERWGYVDKNVATLVSPPAHHESPTDYLDTTEVAAVLEALAEDEWAARWYLALLGLRQGEVLGLPWAAVDLNDGVLRVDQALQRQLARHGCGNSCGRKRGADCPRKIGGGLVVVPPKSRASRRQLVLPATVTSALRSRRAAQARDQLQAGSQWANKLGLVFTTPFGRPVDAKADNRAWKDLLLRAGVRGVRLHDARHTTGTVLALSGIHPRAQMEWMGHSQISQTMRYTHVLKEVAQDTSERLGRSLFGA